MFVVEDGHGVGGYIVGAPDTRNFEARLEAEWWPDLREIYSDPSDTSRAGWSLDQLSSTGFTTPITRQVRSSRAIHLTSTSTSCLAFEVAALEGG